VTQESAILATDRAREDWGDASAAAVLNAIPQPILALNEDDIIIRVNYAALQFFLRSERALLGKPVANLLGPNSEILTLIERTRQSGTGYKGRDIRLDIFHDSEARVDVQVQPITDQQGGIFISLEPQTALSKLSKQLATHNAARAAKTVAAMLAHEIKNPLSGIRGAAQLIEEVLSDEDAPLTQLIIKETDRIVALVDEMEVFSDDRPLQLSRLNIHQVLDHVLAITRNGFAADQTVKAFFDPSLPEIDGNWNQLVQVFLNLTKNASEAAKHPHGVIEVRTAYSHGTRIRIPNVEKPIDVPIEITVSDNGPGIPDDIKQSIFDPFVTNKSKGKGLGLALVSKIIDSHRGLVSCERKSGRTVFRVLLPATSHQSE